MLTSTACQGDSGGLLGLPIPPTPDCDSHLAQTGITSFGLGCAQPKYPGVYAYVSNPIPLTWIKNKFDDVKIIDKFCRAYELPLPEAPFPA